eukprot:1767228-Alexandrium_andersonii.AAC.1
MRTYRRLDDLAEAREPLGLEIFVPALQHVLDEANVQLAQELLAEGLRHTRCGAELPRVVHEHLSHRHCVAVLRELAQTPLRHEPVRAALSKTGRS